MQPTLMLVRGEGITAELLVAAYRCGSSFQTRQKQCIWVFEDEESTKTEKKETLNIGIRYIIS